MGDAARNPSTALVTGATSGIGKEISRQLAALGWDVLIGARDPERGEKVAAEVAGKLLVLDSPPDREHLQRHRFFDLEHQPELTVRFPGGRPGGRWRVSVVEDCPQCVDRLLRPGPRR